MGKKKKKFVDKKSSTTYRFLFRDSSDPSGGASDGAFTERVFVSVDRNDLPLHALLDPDDDAKSDQDLVPVDLSIFADANGDEDDVDIEGEMASSYAGFLQSGARMGLLTKVGGLPEDVRKETLELGFPDDGYNYLVHLREIKQAGGGSTFYPNSKARLDRVPSDVKAYDASKLPMQQGSTNTESMYAVASKKSSVKVQKAIDPDVAALLDDEDMSRFESDTNELEEDFVLLPISLKKVKIK